MPNFFIGPYESGLERDIKPWLLPEDAFSTLEDAYVFRGRVEKRKGFNLYGDSQLTSRLRMNLGTTAASPFAGNIPGAVPIPRPGQQMFSIGSVILTANNTGAGVQPLISTDPTYTGTLDNTTGAYVINHPAIAATSVYYYPGLPVMGIRTREAPTVNLEDTVTFDIQWAYRRSGGGWDRLGTAPGWVGTWAGTDSDFFWSCNYRGLTEYDKFFFVVNGVAADNIKYISYGTTLWVNLRPQLNTGVANRWLETAKIILPFKDRLLVLNTIEDDSVADRSYPNRARWSINGDPTTAATSWIDDTPGSGGYIDAPTSEAIISAQFVKDRLIVFFERSTWELVYTGNEILPFTWKQINTELGCKSPFSQVVFDDGIVGIGNRGIHIANSIGVQRIDAKIPDEVYNINNPNQGPERVYGIRDFERELIYWSFPSFVGDITYPNRVLVYNYRNNTFAFFNDNFTCYGYYNKDNALAWNNLPYSTWSSWNVPWNSGSTQINTPLVSAGNQQGWTFLFEDTGTNAPSLMVTNIVNATRTFTVPDHNLQIGQYVRFDNLNGMTAGVDQIYQIDTVPSVDTFTIDDPDVIAITGTYTGGGTVEVLNKLDVWTKDFPFFTKEDLDFRTSYFNLYLGKTSLGEITFEVYLNSNTAEPLEPTLGTKVVNTHPETTDDFSLNSQRIWHRTYRSVTGDSVQCQFTLNDDQMRDLDIQSSDFSLHAMIIKAEPTGVKK